MVDFYAIGRVDLGMSDAEFWKTPITVFWKMLDRWKAVRRESWLQAGTIVAPLLNVNLKQGAKAFEPVDFVPTELRDKAATTKRKMSVDEMYQRVQTIHAQLGGRTKK